ncbi:hypothetical protein CRYUN_Cryun37aG0132100 [Craigia yunnanensis]
MATGSFRMAVAGAIFGVVFGGWINDSTNGLLITGGQFLSYLINLAFTKTPGTWRWMLGVAGAPAVVQFVLMLSLPESPTWLYRRNKAEEARSILEKIYPANEVEDELKALKLSIEAEKADEQAIGDNLIAKPNNSPVRMICFKQDSTGAFSGHFWSQCCRLYSASHAPKVNQFESTHFATNAKCPRYFSAPNPSSWNCMSCLKADCALCANGANEYSPGACLAMTTEQENSCHGQRRTWFKDGCRRILNKELIKLLKSTTLFISFKDLCVTFNT